MDATEIVSGMMLQMFSVSKATRTPECQSEIPDLPAYVQKRFRPDAAYSQRSIFRYTQFFCDLCFGIKPRRDLWQL